MSIATPRAPITLPSNVRKDFAPGSTILSCPNRIIVPYSENHIRLLAPLCHCKSATATLSFGYPTDELSQMIGSTKEVFYHASTGISYVGTFVAVAVGEVEQSEYANLPKHMKEAIVKHTFPSRDAFLAASKTDADRLRNWYMAGKAKAQYLSLRFVGFNRPLFAALNAHAAKTGISPAAAAGTKRSASADVDAGHSPAKKARLAAQLVD